MEITDSFAESLRRLGSSRSDELAWKVLLTALWPLLFATSYRILRGHRELAEDAAQETLVKLFRYAKFEEFTDHSQAFYSYALAVSRNVSLGYLTELKRLQSIGTPSNASASADINAQDPEFEAIWNQLLEGSVPKISEDDRKLLNLLLQGYTIAEIAAKFKISYSNAAVRIHRLRSNLANLLQTK